MDFSLLNSLKKIGEPKQNSSLPSFPSGFHSTPSNLKAAMRAMNSPEVWRWYKSNEEKWIDLAWTEECQDLTTDGQSWYYSSNNNKILDFNRQRIYRFPENMDIRLGKYFSVGRFGRRRFNGKQAGLIFTGPLSGKKRGKTLGQGVLPARGRSEKKR